MLLFFLRFISTYVIMLSLSFVFSVIFLFRPFHPNNIQWLTRFLRSFIFKILGIRVITENFSSLANQNAKVIIGNHQHTLDLLIFGCHIPQKTLAIGKKSLVYIPFFGWLYYLGGHILINRKNHTCAMKTMANVRQKMLRQHCSIFMMPEGTRTGGTLQKFKPGAFRLAVETQTPIHPIVASTYHKSLNFRRWHSGTVYLQALPPISTLGKTLDDVHLLADQAHKQMTAAIKKGDRKLVTGYPRNNQAPPINPLTIVNNPTV